MLYGLRKSSKTVESIFLLTSHGYGQDAKILLRSLLELLLNLKYVGHDPDKRVPLFTEYAYLEIDDFDKLLSNYVSENPDDVIIQKILTSKDVDQRTSERKEYERVKKNYPNKHNWAGMSVRKMAKSVGLSFQYILYKMFCRVTHPSSEGIKSYLGLDDESLACLDSTPEDLRRTFLTSCIYLLDILSQVNDGFSLDYGKHIDNVYQQVKSEIQK
ncbi:MAG: hypothetical protein OJF52_001312 [Nitrospira sp.]|nr:MAG: hypothetical protein OJF52_001312 [Nitrospira sp.]